MAWRYRAFADPYQRVAGAAPAEARAAGGARRADRGVRRRLGRRRSPAGHGSSTPPSTPASRRSTPHSSTSGPLPSPGRAPDGAARRRSPSPRHPRRGSGRGHRQRRFTPDNHGVIFNRKRVSGPLQMRWAAPTKSASRPRPQARQAEAKEGADRPSCARGHGPRRSLGRLGEPGVTERAGEPITAERHRVHSGQSGRPPSAIRSGRQRCGLRFRGSYPVWPASGMPDCRALTSSAERVAALRPGGAGNRPSDLAVSGARVSRRLPGRPRSSSRATAAASGRPRAPAA